MKNTNPVFLGETAKRVFGIVQDLQPEATSRRITTKLEDIVGRRFEISQVRKTLRSLRDSGLIEDKPGADRVLRYHATREAVSRIERGEEIREEREAEKARKSQPVEPMSPAQFDEALKMVAKYDLLITRMNSVAYRDRRDFDEEPRRAYVFEGDLVNETAGDMVKILRSRRTAITNLGPFRVAMKAELDEVLRVPGDDDVER